jgi:hypothetical protein
VRISTRRCSVQLNTLFSIFISILWVDWGRKRNRNCRLTRLLRLVLCRNMSQLPEAFSGHGIFVGLVLFVSSSSTSGPAVPQSSPSVWSHADTELRCRVSSTHRKPVHTYSETIYRITTQFPGKSNGAHPSRSGTTQCQFAEKLIHATLLITTVPYFTVPFYTSVWTSNLDQFHFEHHVSGTENSWFVFYKYTTLRSVYTSAHAFHFPTYA